MIKQLERRKFTVKPEARFFDTSKQSDAQDQSKMPRIVGHAAVFNQPQNVYDLFIETFVPGCFDDSLADPTVPIVYCINHDMDDIPIARYVAGNPTNTLKLSTDDIGLVADCEPIDSERGRELVESIKRGDTDGMSITFIATEFHFNGYSDGLPMRFVTKAQLFDVTATYFPVFPQTDLALRSKQRADVMAKDDYAALLPKEQDMTEKDLKRIEYARRAAYLDVILRNKNK